MILRKPYAFLIKNFKKIHLILLAFAIFIFVKNTQFINFVKEYMQTGIYNVYGEPVSNYASFFAYFSCVLIIVGSAILIYLLFFKKKPRLLYYVMITIYLFTIISFAFGASYFNNIGGGLINVTKIRLVLDLLRISLYPQYLMLILIGIRAVGLDLKKFGFQNDDEFLQIKNEDNEEFEFEVKFDKADLKRNVKGKFRNLKYYYLEHKTYLNMYILLGTLIIFSVVMYQMFVVNRVYREKDIFKANSYSIKINKSYVTNKDLEGNVIEKNKAFIILDVSVKNLGVSRTIDVEKFLIMNNNAHYVPNLKYNNYFKDLGKTYQKQELKPNGEFNFILVYKVDKKFLNSKYGLFYQEIKGPLNTKLKKVIIKPKDLSKIDNTNDKTLGQPINISIDTKNYNLTMTDYNILGSVNYYYEKCYIHNCPIVEGNVLASNGMKILKIAYESEDLDGFNFLDFLTRYGKIIYIDNSGESKEIDIIKAVKNKYVGNEVYITIPSEVEGSTGIILNMKIRNQEINYKLR